MQYLVYHKFESPLAPEQLTAHLRGVADKMYACNELITIDATETLTLSLLIDTLHDFLGESSLQRDDILYLFYPDAGGQIALWPFKKQGNLLQRKRETVWTTPGKMADALC
ncbi:hypothetical protein [Taibaiella koreensis]|uniref:hypothetical protein n=1 Tax=Taibaiella koreensis TaxID=1268548 RepID=UPI000E59D271|nr:hypothetical protein [Taibaiella koreensis]